MESLRPSTTTSDFKPSQKEETIFAYRNKKSFYIDNTRKLLIRTFSILVLSVLAFNILSNFIYIDIKNNCFITIDPGVIEFNNASLVDGIGLIKKVSPDDYTKVCENVRSISPNVGCGGLHGGCYYENQPKKIYVNSSNRNVLYSAAIIVHETCHSIQAAESRNFDENECYQADDRIIKMIVQY